MKKIFVFIPVLLLAITIHAQHAMVRQDTNMAKSNILEFNRLTFKRTSVDSMLVYCGFPFYTKDQFIDKMYRSKGKMQQELKDIAMRSKFRQIKYEVKSLYRVKNSKVPFLTNKQYNTYEMVVYMPEVGEGPGGTYQKRTFYVDLRKPYHIIGISVKDL